MVVYARPLLSQLANAQPGVLKKIYRPYLIASLGCKQRLAVLTSHYDFDDSIRWKQDCGDQATAGGIAEQHVRTMHIGDALDDRHAETAPGCLH